MADEATTPEPGSELFPRDWREQVRLYGGRKGFIRKELKRLGFWPPQPGSKYKQTTKKEEAELDELYAQLIALRGPLLDQIEEIDKKIEDARKQIRGIGNTQNLAAKIEAVVAEARILRIARVKKERAEKKERRARELAERAEKYLAWRRSTLPHLGRGVSAGLKYLEGEEASAGDEKLRALGLPILHTAPELAQAIGIEPGRLAWLSYHRGASTIDHYNHFSIAKKSGGKRAISSPKPKLREAQSLILNSILHPVPVHEAAQAFRHGLSIADNAQKHRGAAIVLRIDLEDFFPSITFKRVKWTFERLGYNEGIASILALLCTEAPRAEATLDGKTYHVALGDRFLPQGACTSPAITNILCRDLDARLSGAARKYGFTYTRYADDLVFSSPDAKSKVLSLRELVTSIITDEKFVVNTKKTAIMRGHNRQTVTGLVVNSTGGEETAPARVSREDMRRFRAFLHGYATRGREAMTEQIGQDAASYATGYLSFIHMVSPEQEARIKAAHPWLDELKRPNHGV